MATSAESMVRKTVTILFCDVVGSTSLGERIDPETARRVMLRYFDETRTVLERHGAYGFYFQDLDNNWWEIQHEPRAIDDFFDRGDIADMSVVATDSAESHE